MPTTQVNVLPWYREPWPWLLMAGPVAVILAGAITVWLAISSSDGLVVDDYYRQGLAINQTLQRDALALQRGYRGEVQFDGRARTVTLKLAAAEGALRPDALTLRIVHPTRAGQDRLLLLHRTGDGTYQGIGGVLPEGRRRLVLADAGGTWRLGGSVVLPAADVVNLETATVR